MVWVTGSGPDEPDAVWHATFQQTTWTDHAGWWNSAAYFVITPALPDKRLEFNVNLLESSFEDGVTLGAGAGGAYDGNTMGLSGTVGTFQTTGSRFARNRASPGSTTGQGGMYIAPPPGKSMSSRRFREMLFGRAENQALGTGGSLMPTMVFENSEWTDNSAAQGAAIYVLFGQADLRLQRCLVRGNEALVSGGAITVIGNQALTLVIERSVFDANAVTPPPNAGTVDLTVRLNTVRVTMISITIDLVGACGL